MDLQGSDQRRDGSSDAVTIVLPSALFSLGPCCLAHLRKLLPIVVKKSEGLDQFVQVPGPHEPTTGRIHQIVSTAGQCGQHRKPRCHCFADDQGATLKERGQNKHVNRAKVFLKSLPRNHSVKDCARWKFALLGLGELPGAD